MDLYFVLLLVSAVFTTSYAEPTHEELFIQKHNILEQCRNITGVTTDQLRELDRMKVPTEKEPQCFLACTLKKMDMMQDDNKFSKDAILKLVEPYKKDLENNDKISYETVVDIIDSCIAELPGDEDECVEAKNAFECVLKYVKKEGIIP